MGHHSCCNKQKVKRGLWSPEEDEKLINYISTYGHGCWSSVPKHAGLQRCGKSCRLRWINYLRPDLKRVASHSKKQHSSLSSIVFWATGQLNCRWSQIAKYLPGRTDNEVKNFWNSSIKKRLLMSQDRHHHHHQLHHVPPNSPLPSDHHVVPNPNFFHESKEDFFGSLHPHSNMILAAAHPYQDQPFRSISVPMLRNNEVGLIDHINYSAVSSLSSSFQLSEVCFSGSLEQYSGWSQGPFSISPEEEVDPHIGGKYMEPSCMIVQTLGGDGGGGGDDDGNYLLPPSMLQLTTQKLYEVMPIDSSNSQEIDPILSFLQDGLYHLDHPYVLSNHNYMYDLVEATMTTSLPLPPSLPSSSSSSSSSLSSPSLVQLPNGPLLSAANPSFVVVPASWDDQHGVGDHDGVMESK